MPLPDPISLFPSGCQFDQVNYEPLDDRRSVLRFIYRADGTHAEVHRVTLDIPYEAFLETIFHALDGIGADVRNFDKGRVIAWGIRAFISNANKLRAPGRTPLPMPADNITSFTAPTPLAPLPPAPAVRKRRKK